MRFSAGRAVALLALLFTACGETRDTTSIGGPARIVSLSPALTDCVVHLGAGQRLVGVSASCAAAVPGCDGATIVGEEFAPDTGAILALQPHLVLVSSRMDETSRRGLESVGTRVAALPEPSSLQEVSNNILAVGALLGDPLAATERAHAWQVEMSALLPHFGDTGASRPRVFLLVHARDLWTTGSRTCMGEIAEGMGLGNVYASDGGYQSVTVAGVAARSPEFVLSFCGEEGRVAGTAIQAHCPSPPRIIEVESWRALRISGPSLRQAVRRFRDQPELREILP